jgi:hypothetical protein
METLKFHRNYSVATKPRKVSNPTTVRLCRLMRVQIKNRLMFVQTVAPVDVKFKMQPTFQ